MRKISIIGIGAGDPEYLTVQAINALRALARPSLPPFPGRQVRTPQPRGSRRHSDEARPPSRY